MKLRKSATAAPQADPATQPDFWSVLSSRAGRKPGRVYKRGAAAFVDGMPVDPVINATQMSATFCISKPIEDRSADVVNPEGGILENYRLNPVVFFDHGFSGISMPIGKSEDPDGNLSVVMSPDEVLATCFFSQNTCEGCQTFALVEERILRAASVNIMPIDADVRVSDGPSGRPGLLIKSWELIEWSVVGIPDNPEAVRKVLDRGKLADSPISEPILKSLRSYAAPIPSQGRGWTPSSTINKSGGSMPDPEEEKQKRRKAAEEEIEKLRKEYDGEGDEAKKKGLRERMKSIAKDSGMSEDEANIPEEPGEYRSKSSEPDGDETPLGAQILGAAYNAMSEVADRLEQSSKTLENPEVKDYIGSMTDALRGHMDEMNTLHKEQYPDHPELSKEDPEDDGMDKEDAAEGLAKFLARSKTHRLGVRGIGHELMKLSSSRHMPKQFRDKLNQMSRRLAGISKSAEAGAKTALTNDQAAEVAAVRKELSDLKAALQEAMPHRRS